MLIISYITLPTLFGVEDPQAFLSSVDLQAKNVRAALFMQAMVSSLGAFLIPSILFSVLLSGWVLPTLKLDFVPTFKYFAVTIVAVLAGGLFIQYVVEINSKIPLPPALQSLRDAQETAEKMLNVFFSGTTVAHFLLLAVVVAVLPAVSEELMFRGIIQNQLSKTRLGNYGAIVVSGFLFSLMHAEFNNFLAIWIMGIVLGWIFYTTQSLWVSITAHFVNNFATVLLKYLFVRGTLSSDIAEASPPAYVSVIGLVILIGCLYALYKWKIDEQVIEFEIPNESEQI